MWCARAWCVLCVGMCVLVRELVSAFLWPMSMPLNSHFCPFSSPLPSPPLPSSPLPSLPSPPLPSPPLPYLPSLQVSSILSLISYKSEQIAPDESEWITQLNLLLEKFFQ